LLESLHVIPLLWSKHRQGPYLWVYVREIVINSPPEFYFKIAAVTVQNNKSEAKPAPDCSALILEIVWRRKMKSEDIESMKSSFYDNGIL
jgi:hypothetical protein